MFLTSAWSGTPTIVDTARLTRFSQCWDGSIINEFML